MSYGTVRLSVIPALFLLVNNNSLNYKNKSAGWHFKVMKKFNIEIQTMIICNVRPTFVLFCDSQAGGLGNYFAEREQKVMPSHHPLLEGGGLGLLHLLLLISGEILYSFWTMEHHIFYTLL